jgi:hypothetical protein
LAPPRPPAHVQSFEAFDLVAYACREQGYEVRPGDGGPGIAVLENAALRDRVAVAQTQDGRWIYADIREYAHRGPGEAAERALARLRGCIDRSPSKGDAAAFAARVEDLRRGVEAGRSGGTVSAAASDRQPERADAGGNAARPPTPEPRAQRPRSLERGHPALEPKGGAPPEHSVPVDSSRALSKRHYGLAPLGSDVVPRGRGPDRGR